jgi:23S rRNA (guanosine2251-2'-O)-methyltransferase
MSPRPAGAGRGRGGRSAGPRPNTGRGPSPDRRDPGRRERRHSLAGELGGDQVEGRRAVLELLAAGRRPVRRLWLAEGLDPSPQLDEIEALAVRRKVRVETVGRVRLDAEARTDAPQGVLALARPIEPVDLDELCQGGTLSAEPFLLVVSGVTDPRNLGALLRSAECAGVTGVVLARHRAAHLSPTVAKVAAGAIEHLAFAVVGGIPAALTRMRDLGVWTVGLAGEADRSVYQLPLGSGPVALVVGSEERGLPPLVRRRCDEVVAIPQHGSLTSLNVGVAGAVACFEVARQRTAAPS